MDIGGRDIVWQGAMTPERIASVLAIVTERWPGNVMQDEPGAVHIHRDAQTFEWSEAEGVTERVAPNLISIYFDVDSTTFVRDVDDASPGAQLVAALLESLRT